MLAPIHPCRDSARRQLLMRTEAAHQQPLDAAACCALLLLTHTLLMTPPCSKARSDPIRYGQVRDLLPFDNSVYFVEMNGEFLNAIRNWNGSGSCTLVHLPPCAQVQPGSVATGKGACVWRALLRFVCTEVGCNLCFNDVIRRPAPHCRVLVHHRNRAPSIHARRRGSHCPAANRAHD